MLKKLRDELSEKTKLIIYISITAAVFISACLLPLAFKAQNLGEDHFFDTGERAAMFVQYQKGDKAITSKLIDSPSKADSKYCETIMSELSSMCRIDAKSGKLISKGSEYKVITDDENSMRLCRMWIQDEGDWTNWMDVYFDMDTGYVYYLYVSSICLNNANDYINAIDGQFNSKSVAELVAKTSGFELKHFSWSGNVEDTAYAVTSLNGDTVCWNINCTYYSSTMLDVRISVA